MMPLAFLALIVLALPGLADAHGLPSGSQLVAPLAWTFDPWVVCLLALSLAGYVAGYLRLRGRAKRSRRIHSRQFAAYLGGWCMTVLALNSPLDALSAALFSAHMVQHEVLMLLAAPLLVLGRPLAVWMWAFPPRWRHAIGQVVRATGLRLGWRVLISPAVAWVLHAVALWVWHAPPLFEAALARPGIHALQHASFFLSALLFWWTVLGERTRLARNGHAMLSVFTTMMHTGALGALLTFAPDTWYPSYLEPSFALGFDPLEDQQLGGLIMWVPGGLAYFAAGLAIASRWLMRKTPALAGALASASGKAPR